MRALWRTVVLGSLVVGVALGGRFVLASSVGEIPTRIVVNGGWSSDGEGATLGSNPGGRPVDRLMSGLWSADLEREGNRVRGHVVLPGMIDIPAPALDAEITGTRILGELSDDDGNQVAQFEGEITISGFAGRFETVQGDVGSWSWSKTPPETRPDAWSVLGDLDVADRDPGE